MLGLRGVDIGLFEDRSHLQPSSEFKNVRGSARKLRKKLEENGLVAADLFLQLALDYQSRAINNPSAAIRRRAREARLPSRRVTTTMPRPSRAPSSRRSTPSPTASASCSTRTSR